MWVSFFLPLCVRRGGFSIFGGDFLDFRCTPAFAGAGLSCGKREIWWACRVEATRRRSVRDQIGKAPHVIDEIAEADFGARARPTVSAEAPLGAKDDRADEALKFWGCSGLLRLAL